MPVACACWGVLALVGLTRVCEAYMALSGYDADSVSSEYERFLSVHGPSDSRGGAGSVAYADRLASFEAQLARISTHNQREPAPRWTAAVNALTDLTASEQRALFGYRRQLEAAGGDVTGAPTSFLQHDSESSARTALDLERGAEEATVDWRRGLTSAAAIPTQGDCGSCWALVSPWAGPVRLRGSGRDLGRSSEGRLAAVGALEMHLEIATNDTVRLAPEELLHCVPNPRRCGGDGGCDGATSKLAFQYVLAHGLGESAPSIACEAIEARKGRSVAIGGVVQLPRNQARPLLEALAAHGPVAAAIEATELSMYGQGIYDSCLPDAVVNHAVLAVGYGSEQGDRYWLLRNSWGRSWGEEGHFRLLRHGAVEEYCGMDMSPQEGVGCVGGVAQVRVCGMCGVLYDLYYPKDVRLVKRRGSVLFSHGQG